MRAAILLPDPEQSGLTTRERVAIRTRNSATTTGRCDCGAALNLAGVAAGEIDALSVAHGDECPATSRAVERAEKRLGQKLAYKKYVVEIPVPV